MKKTYDWNIRFWIIISNDQRKLEMVASVHTNIHKLKIQIAKLIGISALDSHIDLYFKGHLPLKATSTLLQNQVENGSVLSAKIQRMKIVERLPLEGKKQSKMKEKVENGSMPMIGLSIVSYCTNKDCVNYNQDIEIQYGFGEFPILSITAFTKCELCPYKSQYLRPNMICKAVRVNKCSYKLRGSQLNSCGIPIANDSGFFKTKEQRQLKKFLQDRPWSINLQLVVKQL